MGKVLARAHELIAPQHEIRSMRFLAQQCLVLTSTTTRREALTLRADQIILGTQTTQTDISHTRHDTDLA